MSTKHTPGPWKQTENKELDCTFIQSPTGLIIAKIRDFGMMGEVKANAKLIASAPKLLEALKKIRNYFGENDKTVSEHKMFAIVDEAIKKATE